ncbi:hypothetical protein [Streptomyces sp. Ac-502]|uniref:hypothetical protein n=1 Tax=Streptomyces sp. Ac-502 TaxID=3342801 RepID=UPI0038627A75
MVAVAIATPHSWVIRRVEGTRSPAASSPVSIRRRISATMRRYGGVAERFVAGVAERSMVAASGSPY